METLWSFEFSEGPGIILLSKLGISITEKLDCNVFSFAGTRKESDAS